MMPVTKVMPVYFASFSTENLKSLNVPGKKKERLKTQLQTLTCIAIFCPAFIGKDYLPAGLFNIQP